MSNIFSDIEFDTEEFEKDTINESFEALSSNVYDGIIKAAYEIESNNTSSRGITLEIDIPINEEKVITVKDTLWYFSGKSNSSYYTVEATGKKVPLISLVLLNELSNILLGCNLNKLNIQNKIVKIYNYAISEEEELEVPVLVDLIGQNIKVGLLKEVYQKNDGSEGTKNTVNKFFDYSTGKTVKELKNNLEAENIEKWLKSNKDKVKGEKKRGRGSEKSSSKKESSKNSTRDL